MRHKLEPGLVAIVINSVYLLRLICWRRIVSFQGKMLFVVQTKCGLECPDWEVHRTNRA